VEDNMHSGTQRITLLAAVLTVGTGCTIGYGSKNGELFFQDDELVGWPSGFQNGGPILVGTTICPSSVACSNAADCPTGDHHASEYQACFTPSVSGAGSGHDWCVDIDGAGPVTWSFTAKDCLLAPYPGQDDEVTFTGIEAADTSAAFVQWPEVFAEALLVRADGRNLASDWRNPLDGPVHVSAGNAANLPIGLVDATGAFVSYDLVSAQITSTGAGQLGGDMEHATVTVAAGDELDVDLTVEGTAFAPIPVIGTADADLASLEIVDAYYAPGDGTSAPAMLRAVIRDKSGNLVYGVPVTWKVVDGGLAFQEPSAPVIGSDYQQVADLCIAPTPEGGARATTVEATAGALTSRITLTWTVAPSDVTDFTPDSTCLTEGDDTDGGKTCGCASAGSAPSFLAFAAIGLLLARRRR
jgi:MYXO-CTERM domain-containing protein